jgi:hypothetical protein
MIDSAKDLLKNKQLLAAVEGFFGDKTFYYEVTSRVKEIVDDGKLDGGDIPNIILLVSTILNKSPKLKINKAAMKPLLKLVIIRLLIEVKFVKDAENPLSDEQEMYIDSGLALLDSKVTLDGCFQYLKDVICGCLNNEDSIVSEFLSKQKATRGIVKAAREMGVLQQENENIENGDAKENVDGVVAAAGAAATVVATGAVTVSVEGEEPNDVEQGKV